MRALSIAATGMNAQQTNLEVISNNIANINTTGFKRARAEFTDLLYQTERQAGVANAGNASIVPEGVNIGLGVKTAAVRNLHEQGELQSTSNPLDVAIIGKGWFQVEAADGSTVYTRDGAFNTNADGDLVTLNGAKVVPNINIPIDAKDVTINASGQVVATLGSDTKTTQLGQLTVATFVNDAGLDAMGDNLFRQTPASGDPTVGVPNDPGFGKLQQSYLEASNVDAVKEITDLISAQRAYEMNSKVIQAADDMASVVSKNLR
jgi:flagellar basal-body rod protein FlgG